MDRPYRRGNLLAKFSLFCRSYPLARPRLNKCKQVYQPLSNQQEVISELERYDKIKIDRPMFIDVSFYFTKKGNEDYPTSPFFGDVDNHVKALLDNLQRTQIISNDRLVVEIHAIKKWSSEDYIEIEIYGVKNDIQSAKI